MFPIEFFYVLVIVLCAWGFLKAGKAVVKLAIIIGGLAFLMVYVIPHFRGF